MMTRTLSAGLNGQLGPDFDPRCARSCHVIGEPGIGDGGFGFVQDALGVSLPRTSAGHLWSRLPRELRRLGGVGCTGCHGPAAIPTPGVSRTVLRTDVCAVCHDAPPRYGHVAAWNQTRMSRADADERTHKAPCSHCHTTAGFLESQDKEFLDWQFKSPAADSAHITTGVSCSACHDPHGGTGLARLVRAVEPSPFFSESTLQKLGTTGVCIPCHVPTAEARTPESTAAALLYGRGGLHIGSGDRRSGPTQHEGVSNGCLGCHLGASKEISLERGATHAFRANLEGCTTDSCHQDPASADGAAATARISARAHALLSELGPRLGAPVAGAHDADPPHAASLELSLDSPLARAYYNAALVAEDPAAAYHNAAYARALLDEAEEWLRKQPGK